LDEFVKIGCGKVHCGDLYREGIAFMAQEDTKDFYFLGLAKRVI